MQMQMQTGDAEKADFLCGWVSEALTRRQPCKSNEKQKNPNPTPTHLGTSPTPRSHPVDISPELRPKQATKHSSTLCKPATATPIPRCREYTHHARLESGNIKRGSTVSQTKPGAGVRIAQSRSNSVSSC